MKKISKVQWLIVLVLVVVLGGGLAYYMSTSTANWTAYSNSGGKYSLKYPKGWAHLECEGGAELLLGANQSSLGTCADAGQMIVLFTKGDVQSQLSLSADASFSGVVKESVKVNGITGQKQTANVKDATATKLPVGTKVIEYYVYTNGNTYAALYAQRANSPNAQSEFGRMVTKTLKFNQ